MSRLRELLKQCVDKLTAAPTEIDDIMIDYYRKNITSMKAQLVDAYPNRASAINSAFNAHITMGETGYYLSVPAFIAQADGMLTEITGSKPSALLKEKGQFKGVSVLLSTLGSDQEALDLLHPLLTLDQQDLMKSQESAIWPRRLPAWHSQL